MAILERDMTSLLADKSQLRRMIAEQNAKMGITSDPTATAEAAQAMSLTLGIRPEENLLSRGIIEMRETHKENTDGRHFSATSGFAVPR